MAGEPITLGEFKTALGELKRQGRLHQSMSAEDALGSITGYIEAARRPLNPLERAGAAVTTVASKAVQGLTDLAGGALNFGGAILGGAAEKFLVGDGGESGNDYSPGFEEGSMSRPIDAAIGGMVRTAEQAVASAAPPAPVSVMAQPTTALGKAAHYLETEAPVVAAQAAGLVASGPMAPALGSASFGGQSWRAAKDAGATDEQAAMALTIGAGGGALQAGLLGKIALRSPGFIPTMVNSSALAATNLGIEAAQDELARHTYDPERDVLAGWKENLAGTAIGVVVAGGLGRTMRDPAARSEADTPLRPEGAQAEPMPQGEHLRPEAPQAEGAQPAPDAPINLTGKAKPGTVDWQAAVDAGLEAGRSVERVSLTAPDAPAPKAEPHPLTKFTPEAIAKELERVKAADSVKLTTAFPEQAMPWIDAYQERVRKAVEPGNPERIKATLELERLREQMTPEQRAAVDRKTGNFTALELSDAIRAAELRKAANVEAYNARKGIGKFASPEQIAWLKAQADYAERNIGRGTAILDEAIGRGAKLPAEAAAAIAARMEGVTLREALADPVRSQGVTQELVRSGVFTAADVAPMRDLDGNLTLTGRAVVEHALLGSVVPDVTALGRMSPEVRNVLMRSIPSILSIEAAWPGFKANLRTALVGVEQLKARGQTVDEALANTTVEPAPWKTDPVAVSLARAFESDGPTSVVRRLQNIAEASIDIGSGEAATFYDPTERTVQSMFQLNMPLAEIPLTPEQIAVLAPVEVKSPAAIAEPTPTLAQTDPAEVPRLARELNVPIEDVANAKPPSAAPAQADLPLTGTSADVGEIVTRWFNRRHEETTWANAKAQTNWEELKAIVGRRTLGETLKQAIGHEEIEARAQAAAASMRHWIELGGREQEFGGVEKIVERAQPLLADPEFAKDGRAIVDAFTLPPELKAMADRLRAEAATEGQLYKEQDLIISANERYTAHLWKDGAHSPVDPSGTARAANPKFATTRARQLQRTFPTLLDGLEAMQARKANGEPYKVLAIRSAIETQRLVREQMATLVIDRNFMEDGLKSGMFSNVHREGFEPINALNFKKWLPAGRLRGEVYEPISEPSLFAGMDRPNITPAQIEAWGPNAYVTPDGQTLFVRQQLYAEADTAKRLNNALGKSALSDIKGFDVTMKYLEAARGQMLAYDFSQHFTIPFRAMMGMQGMAAVNPLGASKTGRAAIMAQTPDVGLLVRNNLRIGTIQDFVELQKQQQTVIGETIDKVPVGKEAKAFAETFRAWQEDWLYRRFIPGLKVQHALLELGRLRTKYADALASGKMSQNEVARMAAESANDLFGGQNLVSRNRNPTTQGIFRLIDIAPDWRESSVRMGAKAFTPGGEVYRRMWLRAAVRGFVATSLWNTMMAGMAQDGEDEKRTFWDRTSGYWKSGRLPMFELDVTPMYRALGGTSDAHKYISILGKMDELYRLTGPQALQFGRQRLGIVPKVLVDGLSGSTPWGQGFTDADQLLGTDDRGIYTQLRIHASGKIDIPGQEKGRNLAGKMTATGLDTRAVDVTRLPSFISYEATGILPAPVQNTMLYLTGQMSAMDSLVRGWGVPMQTEIRPKVKK